MRVTLRTLALSVVAMTTGCAAAIPTARPLDFAAIDSKEKAQGLYREGRLHKVYLAPLEAGGHDAEVNVVYLPEEAAREKSSIDAQIIASAEAGKVYRHRARPSYRGRSVTPARIDVEATGAEAITKQIEVW